MIGDHEYIVRACLAGSRCLAPALVSNEPLQLDNLRHYVALRGVPSQLWSETQPGGGQVQWLWSATSYLVV